MGAEDLMNWEKLQDAGNEEKILVFVRLRPLSGKEIAQNEVADWECINSTTILYRNSLQERFGLPAACSFDRVFRGDCKTREVYDEGIKDIALSVVGGINSTIFAYGQTSSGKTYTMNGITEYAVADIYDYIQKHEERAFALKFSAMEIYNEVVRDLLSSDSNQLRLLDDPEKGMIIEKLTEEALRDWNHLKELLSICEAQRQIGETSLNEKSSRSHQILRLTIESSAREFIGKGNSTTLAATVNFVDLAGSERASQASSMGQRLKEGCHINRSLLTLGTVIRKLSKGRHGHVNYRDSKLTRILQPALGGNARTAIICTLSPARSHAEQSRNTLLFASCAKAVSTNAKVNVVMSDKALVKHLQREVARLESELKAPGSTCDHGALLRKKDMQIEKLEKESRELKKQRDLAHSRIGDLLRAIERDNGTSDLHLSENSLVGYSSDDASDPSQVTEEPLLVNGEDSDEVCSDVRSITNDNADEDLPTLGSFVAGLREMVKLQYANEVQHTEEKNGGDVAIPIKFEMFQKKIIELWQVCNVPLVHRTYFILLINDDLTDSIYMEVEYRRLTFLKETFSRGNFAVQDGRTITLASSKKALCSEREMLSRRMSKRLTEDERNKIYEEWGIEIKSKRRRLRLVQLLWRESDDMDHIRKSAEVVAKIIGLSTHGQGMKEMLGLSFMPPQRMMSRRRRSLRWKNSRAEILM